MLHDTEKQDEHQVGPASIMRDSDLAPAIHIETSSLMISAEGDGDLPRQSKAHEEAPQDAISTSVSAHTITPQGTARSNRKWAKQTADLPRWEKWKRRLPQVCR